MVLKHKKVELNKNYFRIQKYIGSNWENRFKGEDKEEAMIKMEEFVNADSNEYKKFQYRLIKVDELVLIKSIEEKPDNVADIF